MRRREKILLSILVVGSLGSLTATGIFGFFKATTQSSGNEISSGTVSFTDNDSGQALLTSNGLGPGDSVSGCIKATYTGTLPASVRLYADGTEGPLAQHVDLVVTQGTQPSGSFPSCSGFAANSGPALFTGTLSSFLRNRTGFASGVPTTPAGQGSWAQGNAVVYRFQATLQAGAPDSAQGTSTGVHSFVWEAQSQ